MILWYFILFSASLADGAGRIGQLEVRPADGAEVGSLLGLCRVLVHVYWDPQTISPLTEMLENAPRIPEHQATVTLLEGVLYFFPVKARRVQKLAGSEGVQ
jgi:hypothetical protein